MRWCVVTSKVRARFELLPCTSGQDPSRRGQGSAPRGEWYIKVDNPVLRDTHPWASKASVSKGLANGFAENGPTWTIR